MSERRSYKVVVDMRRIGYTVLGIIWLILLFVLLSERFFWDRIPWFVETFYPPLKNREILQEWWISRWSAVYVIMTVLAMGICAFFLRRSSIVWHYFSAALRNFLFFSLAITIGLHGCYMTHFCAYPDQTVVFSLFMPMIISILIFTCQVVYFKLRNRRQQAAQS